MELELCPTCGKKLREDLEAHFCPFCGADLDAGEAAGAQAASTESPLFEREGIAWEAGGQIPFLQRLTQTWSESVFQPAAFFRKMPVTGGIGMALLYALIFQVVGNAFAAFWQKNLLHQLQPFLTDLPVELESLFAAQFERQLIFAPVLGIIGLFLASFVLHVSLLILGAAKNGYEATFRSLAYAEGPMLFYAVPFVGGLIGFVWGAGSGRHRFS